MLSTVCAARLAGFVVTDISFGRRITVIARRPCVGREGPLEASLWFGGPLTFRDESGREHDLDARDAWEFHIALLELRHQVIESVVADETSQIQVSFELGQMLSATTQAEPGTWGLLGPGGLNLVGLPAGQLVRLPGGQ